MEDADIIELYFLRSEDAISKTASTYGAYCQRIAMNILYDRYDSEETVADGYMKVWQTVPPTRPASLGAYLSRIVRNLALSLYRKKHAEKRLSNVEGLLSELDECVPSSLNIEEEIGVKELGRHISEWLRTLAPDDRVLFLRRYYDGDGVKLLAAESADTPNMVSKRLMKLRNSLRIYLEKEGIAL